MRTPRNERVAMAVRDLAAEEPVGLVVRGDAAAALDPPLARDRKRVSFG